MSLWTLIRATKADQLRLKAEAARLDLPMTQLLSLILDAWTMDQLAQRWAQTGPLLAGKLPGGPAGGPAPVTPQDAATAGRAEATP